ncbi:MAG: RHS repeat domain-containing protein [Bacteroides nordii]
MQNNRRFTYGYNLHERLTSIVGPNFEQTFGYFYCGDITSMGWKANSGKKQGYSFNYDGLHRLTSARYREEGRESNHYHCSYTYDKQGNITSLTRNGLTDGNTFGKIDDLSFRYDVNQLIAVDDAAEDPLSYGSFNFRDGDKSGESEYGYDANGNLIFDKNAGIAHITYNLLNQPERIQYTNGNIIMYTYDGLGKKHMASYQTAISGITVPFGSRFDLSSSQRSALFYTFYCSNIIYNNTGSYDENDSFIVTNQVGYCDKNAVGDLVQHYYEKDHQGNNRIVVSDQVEEVNHYYPYGGLFGESVTNGDNLFRYNGKEHYKMFGLGWYDYGARLYNPSTTRFISVDPMCEKYYSVSPYVYCLNNPIKLIEPDGKLPVFLIPLAKGTVGAIVDAAAQVTISMANGQGFSEAMSNIDYTSVGASFVTSALAMPGMSAAAKTATVTTAALDAAVDISSSRGVETVVTGEKTIVNSAVDISSSVLSGKAVDGIISGFNKAVTSDLTATSAATMTKGTLSGLRQAQSLVNSTGFQIGVNAIGSFIGGMAGGQANISLNNLRGNLKPAFTNKSVNQFVQPTDAINVHKPLYPFIIQR